MDEKMIKESLKNIVDGKEQPPNLQLKILTMEYQKERKEFQLLEQKTQDARARYEGVKVQWLTAEGRLNRAGETLRQFYELFLEEEKENIPEKEEESHE